MLFDHSLDTDTCSVSHVKYTLDIHTCFFQLPLQTAIIPVTNLKLPE